MELVDISLIGVLGATLACKHPSYKFVSSGLVHLTISIADTSIRAIGERAHPMHAMVSFSTICVLMASVR